MKIRERARDGIARSQPPFRAPCVLRLPFQLGYGSVEPAQFFGHGGEIWLANAHATCPDYGSCLL